MPNVGKRGCVALSQDRLGHRPWPSALKSLVWALDRDDCGEASEQPTRQASPSLRSPLTHIVTVRPGRSHCTRSLEPGRCESKGADSASGSAWRTCCVRFVVAPTRESSPRMTRSGYLPSKLMASSATVAPWRSWDVMDRSTGVVGLCSTRRPCSTVCWMPHRAPFFVEVLARAGAHRRARERFSHLIERGNDLGLYSEQIDAESSAFLGNYPQALSHLALIRAALA